LLPIQGSRSEAVDAGKIPFDLAPGNEPVQKTVRTTQPASLVSTENPVPGGGEPNELGLVMVSCIWRAHGEQDLRQSPIWL